MARSLQTHPNNTDTHPRRPARRDANSCPAGGSFQGGNKRHQQSKGRGGKVETRVACWPDQAAGQRMHHRSRIQVAASRSATPFGSSGSALGGSSQLERRNNTFPAVHLCRSFRKALPPRPRWCLLAASSKKTTLVLCPLLAAGQLRLVKPRGQKAAKMNPDLLTESCSAPISHIRAPENT